MRAHTKVLLRDHRGPLSRVLGWHVVAALVALVGPWVIGQVVQEVTTGDGSLGRIDRLIALLVAAIVVQTLLTWVARRASFVLSERIFARLREDFITSSVRLPLSVVERAGTGDLVARTTNDVESLAHIIRFGIPAIVVAVTTVVATTVAAFLTSPLAALSLLTAALVHVPTSRWYLKRAGDGYLWEHASYARLNGVASETVEGAHTMDALGLQAARGRRFQDALDECGDAERYTLGLRLRWFPWLEIGFFLPIATAVLWGGWLAWNGHITIAAATAVTLYVQQLLDPLGELISWLDEIQFAATSLARILGVSEVPPDRVATGAQPDGEQVDVDDVRYSYREGRDVLHGVSLGLVPGERLAIVGPSGAGKSTLGPADGGHRRAAHRPGDRRRGAARRPRAARAARRGGPGDPGAPRVRRHPRREPPAAPARTRATPSCARPCPPSTPSSGPTRCPTGSTRWSAPVGTRSPRRRPSSWPWPGWCSPTRTPSCSTRRPRCSTPGPRGTSSGRWRPWSTVARSSRSRTGCTRRTTPTGWPSSRTAWSASWARTTS